MLKNILGTQMVVSNHEMGAPAEVKWQKNASAREREREKKTNKQQNKKKEMRNEEEEERASILTIRVNFIDEFAVGKK